MKDDLRHGEDHSEVSEAVARLQQYHSCLERWLMASSEMWKWVLPFQATCPLKMKNLSHFLLCLLYEFSSSLPPPLANEWIYLVLVWYQHSESFSNEIFWSALDNGQPIPGATIATRAPCTDPTAIFWNQYLPRVPVSAFFRLLIAGLMEPVEERVCCQKTLFLICQLPQKSHSSKIFQMDYNVDQVIFWAY